MSEETPHKRPHSAVTLYVVHHPDCKMAGDLAGKLYEWFRLGYQTGDTGSVSIPFWIRCQLSPVGGLNPRIEFDDASLNIVILLSSHEMVLDRDWRKALLDLQIEIAKRRNSSGDDCPSSGPSGLPSQIELLPAVLDDSFYNLTPIYENHNPLRLSHLESDEAKMAVLRRGVLEMTARTVSASLHEKGSGTGEMRVFLSHAKRDGTSIAEALRDAIRRFGQLTPWYDSNDLAISQGWTKTLNAAMDSTTEGMIAVVTDAYPTRPWCRKELQTARTPREYRPNPPGNRSASKVFALQPVIAVMQLGSNWTRGLATLEGIPRVGWSTAQPLQSIEGIVDRLVLEMMLHKVRRKTALDLALRANDPSVWFLTWVPDGWTLAQLAKEFLKSNPGSSTKHLSSTATVDATGLTIVYPGVELSPAENEDLEIQLQAFGTTVRLLSYQEWDEYSLRGNPSNSATAAANSPRKRSLLIALSAGGDPTELASEGLRVEHVDELFERVTMRVLAAGHRIAFGGSLNNPDARLTQNMIDTTLRWRTQRDESPVASDDAQMTKNPQPQLEYLTTPGDWPLVNYSSFPHCNDLRPEQEARWIGLCRVKRILPRGLAVSDRALKSDCLPLRRDLAKLHADALSKMRRLSSRHADLRIVWGGKIVGASGWMAGILEEIGCSLENRQPVLIIGALGGSAGLVAKFLADVKQTWPNDLSLAACRNDSRDAWLNAEERGALEARLKGYQRRLTEYRAKLHADLPQIAGISRNLLKNALDSNRSTSQILSDVEQFLAEVQAAGLHRCRTPAS